MKTHTPDTRKDDRSRGGRELPDDLQDRPEQHAGYDEAVRGRNRATPVEPKDDAEVIDLEKDTGQRTIRIEGEEGEREGEEG
jgi:hypothetical protein